MIEFFLAFRNLLLRRKRYKLMIMAIVLGFAVISFIHAGAFGVMDTIRTKGARYFAGHISITGYNWNKSIIKNYPALIDKIDSFKMPFSTIAPRTVYYRSDASLFFSGESIRQRRLVGIDFEAEKDVLDGLSFTEGSLNNMLADGENGILISRSASEILGARVGDQITLFLTVDSGQYNTANLIVQGIFNETSLFGFVAYMRQKDLNDTLLWNPEIATDIAIYVDPGNDHRKLVRELSRKLQKDYTVLPYMSSKKELYANLADTRWEDGPVLAPLTLDAHLDQINQIINAVLLVTWFVLVLFILIIMVGILNTYRVLVYERTKEIGTMRSLGMSKGGVRRMFIYEAIILGLVSSAAGFLLSLILVHLFDFINLGNLPGAGLFTEDGLLKPSLNLKMVGINLLIITAGVSIAAFGPANKAARIQPAEALRSTE